MWPVEKCQAMTLNDLQNSHLICCCCCAIPIGPCAHLFAIVKCLVSFKVLATSEVDGSMLSN